MEKGRVSVVTPEPDDRRQLRRHRLVLAAAVSALWLCLVFQNGGGLHRVARFFEGHRCHHHHGVPNDSPAIEFSWDKLEPKPYLEYSDCFDHHQCARLEVPLDYFNGTTNATIALAVVRKPAMVPVTDEMYGGAVLLNPGGPGGSGVAFLLQSGDGVRSIIDTRSPGHDKKFFDLISFDPRGVNMSGPHLECFQSPRLDDIWMHRLQEEGVIESSDAAFGRLWSMSRAYGGSCSLPPADGGVNPKAYVSTASVARDMLAIIEAHGAWREEEAFRLLNPRTHHRGHRVEPVPDSLLYRPNEEKIQYWGFSYGSYLGMTFGAMFPDRVHRLVVDGVVDAYDYTESLWQDNLADTEKAVDLFYYHCARVGFPKCALANETGRTTADGVRERVENITNTRFHDPLPIIGPNPNVITYSDIKNTIFVVLYSPIAGFPLLADILRRIEAGNGSSFASSEAYVLPNAFANIGFGQRNAIACSDGDDQSWLDKDGFTEHWKTLTRMSPSSGSIWAMARLQCIHYTVRPQHRWAGPWNGNTSHPMLFVGNTADPVTPLRNAVKMAEGYQDAAVLTQDSPGHCSSSAFSKCSIHYIREYFQTGDLPPPSTICAADVIPFGGRDHHKASASPGLTSSMLETPDTSEYRLHQSIGEGLQQSKGLLL